nr:hypothetical protein [Tanacetum cinerariifolium]
MATFVSSYISDLSPVNDNIKLCVRILRAWLQPLYNNQQVKNIEMIVMDEHNTKMQATVRMDKLKRFQHHLKEGNALTIQRYSLGEIKPKFRMIYNAMRLSFLSNTEVDSCTDFNGSVHGFVWRSFNSITDLEKEVDGQFDVVGQVIACEDLDNYDKNRKEGNKPVILIDDEGNEIKYTLWGDYAQQFNDFLNSCDDHDRIVLVSQFAMMKFWDGKMCIQNGYRGTKLYLFDCNKDIYEDEYKEDETGTMSLSLFNDEVQAMVGRSAYQLCEKYTKSESYGSIPTEITDLIGNKYAFKVAIDDYNVKKLLHVFTVLHFSNDQEIINSVLACATPIKDLESQTDKNTTPNEKQKTNKRPAEGEPGSESSTGKKKAVEIKVEKDA